MPIHELNTNPSERELRWFGLLLGAFVLGVAGVIAWRTRAVAPSATMGAAGIALAVVYYGVARSRRPIYLAWVYATYPIGLVATLALLAVVYYIVLMPVGLAMRALGRDPMSRRFVRGASSYWTSRPPAPPVERYFRQF